jgi:hypothetical protein
MKTYVYVIYRYLNRKVHTVYLFIMNCKVYSVAEIRLICHVQWHSNLMFSLIDLSSAVLIKFLPFKISISLVFKSTTS